MTRQEVIQVTTPTQHRNVYSALAAAQQDMDAVRKGSVNPAFKSRYADLADVIQAVMPALNKHGIAMFHSMRRVDGENCMVTILAHGESDTLIECAVPLIVIKNDMQGMKSATTYAKRIGAESVTGIAPEDDDGNAAAKAAPRQEQQMIEQPNTATAGLGDAWRDGVLDSLPENATDRQKAEAFAAAICRDFNTKTGTKALENDWDRRKKLIDAFEAKHGDLFAKVVDAYENRMLALTGNLHQGAG